MKKKIIGLLLLIILVIVGIRFTQTVQAKDKGYLVLIQTEKDGQWTAYEGISSKYTYDGAQINASKISKLLSLTYKSTNDGFTIRRGEQKLTFVNGHYTYKYYDGSNTVKKRPPVPSSSDIYYGALRDLSVFVHYFTATKAQNHGIAGYSGVICYSLAEDINSLPDVNRIVTDEGESFIGNEPAKKAPLVLIQTKKNGKWTYYDNLATVTEDGQVMVKALAIANVFGFERRYFAGELRITNYPKELIYTPESKQYRQYHKSASIGSGIPIKTNKSAEVAMYTDWNYGLDMIHYKTLDYLVNVNTYTDDQIVDYKAMGYDSILCYSSAGKITRVPDIKNIIKAKEKPVYKEYANIGGVEIPKLTKFAKSALSDSNWGFDSWEWGYRPLEYALDEYSVQMRSDIMNGNMYNNPGEFARISVLDQAVQAQINGDSTMSVLRLRKADDHYEIYISAPLDFPKDKDPKKTSRDYTKIVNNVMKLFCTMISSTPDELYKVIYTSWEEDSSVISKKKWTVVGDSKVRYRVENRHAGIYSIKAK